MRYRLYDSEEKLHGTFESIYDLELFVDGVRNSRGENRHNSPVFSCFDYIKSIGWYWDIIDS